MIPKCKFECPYVFQKNFTDAAFVRGIPVYPGLEVLQKISLEFEQLLEVDEYRFDLLLSKHVGSISALGNVTFRDVSQYLDKVALRLNKFTNHAGSHLLVRQQRDARPASRRGIRRCPRRYCS